MAPLGPAPEGFGPQGGQPQGVARQCDTFMASWTQMPGRQVPLCRWTGPAIVILLLVALVWSAPRSSSAQQTSASTPGGPSLSSNSSRPPTLSLSPAVIMAKGSHGQGITETLTLSNFTGNTLDFNLIAEDVTTKDGKRIFIPAGETPGSIAATAVFSEARVEVKPSSNVSVRVTFTIPQKTDLRGVVAIFNGTRVAATKGTVGMVASLGTLFVFTLSDDFKVEASPITVTPQGNASNTTFEQWLTNTGTEPLMPEGAAAVLTGAGTLVGKTIIPSQRLLPGEKLSFKTFYPAQLDPGHYRVLLSYQYEGRNLTSSEDFVVQ